MSHKNKQKTYGVFATVLALLITINGCTQTPTAPIATKTQKINITEPMQAISTATKTAQPEMASVDTGYEGYYMGIVAITEYYTLLSNELPEKAYELLSDTAQKTQSLEELVQVKAVEIVTIEPLVVWQKEIGGIPVTADREDLIMFYVQTRTRKDGSMSEPGSNGDLQTQYLTLIKEDELWKIDTVATELAVPTPNISTATPTLDPGSVPDRSYYDSIVVIAQFHVLFNNGLYEPAYQLLSPSRRHAQSLEEFISDIETFGIVERRIVSIRPLYEGALQIQSLPTPDPINRRKFYTQIYAEGKSGWAGSVPNGVHTYFITTVLEYGKWMIYSVNTSP